MVTLGAYTYRRLVEKRQAKMAFLREYLHDRIVKLHMRDPLYAVSVREQVIEKFDTIFDQTQDPRAAHDGAMALLKEFEDRVDQLLAERARQRQAQQVADQQQAVATARARAQAFARANPMRSSEILIAVERSGHRIRLQKESIEVAPSTGLALELEMQVVEHARELGDYLQSRETWRQIAIVPADDAEAEALSEAF